MMRNVMRCLGVCCAVLMLPTILQAALTDNLQGYWQMNDNPVSSEYQTINAAVGPDGFYHSDDTDNKSKTEAVIDTSVAFWNLGSGDADYATLGTDTSALEPGSDSYSVNLWFKLASTTSTRAIMHDGNWGSTVSGFALYYLAGPSRLYARINAGGGTATRTDIIMPWSADVAFHQLSFVIDRTSETATLAVDGGGAGKEASESIAGWGSIENSTTTTNLGGIYNNGTGAFASPFLGYLDEVAIWNRALSAGEISELYNNGDGKVVPEPLSLGLLGLGSLMMMRRRKA